MAHKNIFNAEALVIGANRDLAKDQNSGFSKTDADAASVYSWAASLHRLPGADRANGDVGPSEEERIACLEAIVAILVEKNELFRQQLLLGALRK